MTFREWTKPGVYSALVCGIPVSTIGFTWGGWPTSGGAQEIADGFAKERVALARVPICLDFSEANAKRIAKPPLLQETSSLLQRKAMTKARGAKLPSNDASNRYLMNVCLEELVDGS